MAHTATDLQAAAEAGPAFDEERAGAFAERAAGFINDAAIAAMMSIGHRTGLFDSMADLPPAGSETIAATAGLAERYVREWLAVMVCGGIVVYDPAHKTYRLPAEHAAALTRGAPLGNIAVYAQAIGIMGSIESRLLECFETGDGLPYDAYPGFHHYMAEDSAMTVADQLLDTILPLAPEITARLERGITVLDAGCGRGQALIAMAGWFPHSRFVGYDLCPDAIAYANDQVAARGLENIRFETRDLTHFDEEAAYGLVTSFDAVHDQRDPQDLLRRLFRALHPGGVYIMQDIGGSAHLEKNVDFPMAALLYTMSCTHCTPVSLGQGGLGLGTMWGWETAQAMLRTAGFDSVEHHRLPGDPMNIWFVSRKG